jgi:hypothetical protein
MNKQPELVISENGTKEWYLNGVLHREDGPAVEWVSGYKAWYKNGKLPRTDGPAIETFWWLNGYPYSKEEWFNKLTQEQQYNYLWNLDE